MAHADAIRPAAIKGIGYALIVLTSLVVIARYAASIRRFRDFKAEDYLLIVAYAFFLELTILYIIICPVMYRLAALQEGSIPIYPTVSQDGVRMQIFIFVATNSLWLCLWMIKFSLLSMYKRFLSGKAYAIAWWTILIFCVLFLIGCILSSWFSCHSFRAWFTSEGCTTPRDLRATAISLYFSYAMDILTDLTIMALPLRLIWNLQMKRNQKLGIGALFCIGWVCIIVATIRVAQLGINTSHGMPMPSWLALWGILEASISVIIGSSPGLYRAIKARTTQSQPYYAYDPHGFRRVTASGLPSHRSQGRDIPLSHFSVAKPERSIRAFSSTSPSSSQENLAGTKDGRNIMVTSHVEVTVAHRDRLSEDTGWHETR